MPESTHLSAVPSPPSAERVRLLDAAIRGWKNQLVDLTARNNLLYFKDLRAGTLNFSGKEDHVDQLLGGAEVSLAAVFSNETPRTAFAKRARTIRGKAKELFEERGLETMFLAHGVATWDEDDAERRRSPAAPIALVPVSLEPTAQGSSDFTIRLAGEPRVNPTLLRKLEAAFGVPLAAEEFDIELIDATSIAALEAVFPRLNELAHTVPGFAIERRTILGTFSYAKLPMVLDLDRAREELAAHDLIAALCGDTDARASLRDRNATGDPIPIDKPDHTPPNDEHLVLDADSSQSHAINTILAGRDLIIQGPPGTGKSQTIANLIAALVADGKTVLFVAEKRAAIDAVHKRLRKVGLEQLLLDMHDGQKQRAPFAQELMAAIQAHRGRGEPDIADDQARLLRARQDLNARTSAQPATRAPFGISVFQARVRLEGLPAAARSDLLFPGDYLSTLTSEAIAKAQRLLRQWFSLGAADLFATDSPWSHSTVRGSDASLRALAAVRAAVQTVVAVGDIRLQHAEETGLIDPATPNEWARQLALSQAIRDSTRYVDESIYAEDLAVLCEHLTPTTEGGWARTKNQLASGDYRAAKKTVKAALTADGRDLDRDGLYAQLTAARDHQARWRAASTENATPMLTASLDAAQDAERQLAGALGDVLAVAPTLPLGDLPWADLVALLDAMARDPTAASTMGEVNPIHDALQDLGLSEILHQVRSEGLGLQLALARLDYVWLSSIIEHFELNDRWVSAVKGPEQTVTEFQQLDRLHISSGPARVLRACATASVTARDAHHEQAVLVERQAKLKPRSRKHLPIREFFAEAPDVLRALKPCWAMSPLVVSQTLPAQRDLFDVVIFDEASQVTPADAIPAILRGRQLVIAGDSRQLPPTAFFAQALDDDDEDDEDMPVDAGTAGYESILDALGGLIPERMLTWHYRSQDERLIAFSNTHIYDRSLTTFPGVHTDDVIRHELVPWQPGQTGEEESSAQEARRVVDLIVEHALTRPRETLGVIAMGLKHATAISEELARRRTEWRDGRRDGPVPTEAMVDDDDEDDDADELLTDVEITGLLDEFFDETRDEPFFIKNLERVQGDERDAIILTVGYAKEPATGRMLYRFGPLLTDGGERRLNVAITRAKRRMVVVSSFDADDMDPAKLNKEGAQLLRGFLGYAASEGRTLGDSSELPPELNPFEIAVRDALSERGLDLAAQHGVSGYRIDFAAVHPTEPGRYVLAIECDGASYHSSPTARERDRLRQEHLERLGWRFARIWSSDWFNDRDREIARVLNAYADAVQHADREADDPGPFEPAPAPAPAPVQTASRPRAGARPRIQNTYSPAAIRQLLQWIETDTLPRTRDELFAEALRELGFERAGPKIRPAIEAALELHRGPLSPAEVAERARPTVTPARTAPIVPPLPAGMPYRAASTPRAPLPLPAALSPQSKPTGALADQVAARIRYLPKNAAGPGSERNVNPLVIRGNLMWAWCHKRGDVRCFNLTRVAEWSPLNPADWPVPEHAEASAENAAQRFSPSRRRR
ncbi:AAA domain-containing protein [Conexibacter sp. W3-3-2]|uniref:AAA domain-containing protein n=1 Tax=Conexibacter sp. W3-3-2 TaxID=2675227 RepID=UPI0018AA87BF|nr:AAA domain-containing protein [Conexibacter sp. W3-3-2]